MRTFDIHAIREGLRGEMRDWPNANPLVDRQIPSNECLYRESEVDLNTGLLVSMNGRDCVLTVQKRRPREATLRLTYTADHTSEYIICDSFYNIDHLHSIKIVGCIIKTKNQCEYMLLNTLLFAAGIAISAGHRPISRPWRLGRTAASF